MFDANVTDDKFVLIANANKNSKVAVKTPWGSVTERFDLKEMEMQGTVIAPLKCSVKVDKIGKYCLENGEGIYKYKGCLSIPPLFMVDDIISISKCGIKAITTNL